MPRIYDAPKLKSVLLVGCAALLSMIAVNAVLATISAAYPNWLPRQFFGIDFIADNRQRARLVNLQYRDGVLGADDSFVVILGLSSASEGISLSNTGGNLTDDSFRILGLSGAGRNMRDIDRYAHPILKGEARPALAIFAINLFHLMDAPPAPEAFLQNLQKEGALDQMLGGWTKNRRQDIKYVADASSDLARSSLFDTFEVRIDDEIDPWREVIRMDLAQASVEAQWLSNVQRYGERGYYDAENYLRSETQIGIFLDLVAEFRRLNVSVAVILMPEHSRLRVRIPDAAMRLLVDSLSMIYGNQGPTITDLRDSVPDSGFKDISHMNNDGRRLFNPILGNAIDAQLTNIGEPLR